MNNLAYKLGGKAVVKRLWNSPTFNTWTSLGIKSLNLVILIPFILKSLSPAEISLWYLLNTIISFNLMIDLGLGVTFVRYIAYALGKDNLTKNAFNNDNIQESSGLYDIVSTQQVLFNRMLIIVFLSLSLIGSVVVFKPISHLENQSGGWISWIIIIITTTIGFKGNSYSIYLQGINKITELRRYETIFGIAATVTSIIMLLLNPNIILLVAVNQFWVVIGTVRNRWLCLKYDQNIFKTDQKYSFNKEIFNSIWPSAWRSGLGIVMSYGLIQSSNMYFAQDDDVKEVSSYLFAMRIIQLVVTFSQAPFYSKLPLLARLYAEEQLDTIKKLSTKSMKMAHWVFIVSAISIGIFADYIMQLIHSNISFVDPKLWALISFAFFLERFGAMHIQLYSLSDKIIWHIANGVTGLIYLLGSIILFPKIGVYGFVISLIISYGGFYIWYTSNKSYKEYELSFFDFERSVSLIPFLILSFYVISIFL